MKTAKSEKDVQTKLVKIQLEYYTKLLDGLKAEEEGAKLMEEEEKLRRAEREAMWKKFHKLNDKKVIRDIFEIIKENWDFISTKGLSFAFDAFRINNHARAYFLDKGIDINEIFRDSHISSIERGSLSEPETYFDKYGLKEKIRWEKAELEIRKLCEEYKRELEMKDFDEKVKSFVDLAIEKNLSDVTTTHIKMLARELGEDITSQVGLLTTTVSAELRKHWGVSPKRKRELTKSIKIEVYKRDNYRCVECGKGKEVGLHVHHIIPYSKGGTDEMWNLATLCKSCNRSIGDRRYNPPKSWIGYQIYNEWKSKKK